MRVRKNGYCCNKSDRYVMLPRKDYFKICCYGCGAFIKNADTKEVIKLRKEGKLF